jgi:hypothetical protein
MDGSQCSFHQSENVWRKLMLQIAEPRWTITVILAAHTHWFISNKELSYRGIGGHICALLWWRPERNLYRRYGLHLTSWLGRIELNLNS